MTATMATSALRKDDKYTNNYFGPLTIDFHYLHLLKRYIILLNKKSKCKSSDKLFRFGTRLNFQTVDFWVLELDVQIPKF